MESTAEDAPYFINIGDLPTLPAPKPIAKISRFYRFAPYGNPHDNLHAHLFWLLENVLYSVPMLVMGKMYESQCPVQNSIPSIMIVHGALTCSTIVLIPLLSWILSNKWSVKLATAAFYIKNLVVMMEQLVTFSSITQIINVETIVMARCIVMNLQC
ncbi:unnamed protein product [Adineta ricciae]|uniref:Uncharacterized protein n=1 Tax=Adineta ricciae TaxID=249248 RepID=A0A815W6T9_ADIRI|nr:unnamed protein product [Adineta ricciae]CAF1620814.1 unnamed protein product [Adineta ricciae]